VDGCVEESRKAKIMNTLPPSAELRMTKAVAGHILKDVASEGHLQTFKTAKELK